MLFNSVDFLTLKEVLQLLFTLITVIIAWIFFRAPYISTALFPEEKAAKEKLQLFVQQYFYVYHLYYYFQNRNILKSRILTPDQQAPTENYADLSAVMHLFCSHYPNKFFCFVMAPTLSFSPPNVPAATDTNMRVIDLRNCLDMAADYHQCNTHWNDTGHAKTATALYDSLFVKSMASR